MGSQSLFHGVWTINDGSVLGDGGMKMRLIFDNETCVVNGSGSDALGGYRIEGLFLGPSIRFIKTYVGSNSNVSWTYSGVRLSRPGTAGVNIQEYVGKWGPENGPSQGHFALSNSSTYDGFGGKAEPASWEGVYTYTGQPGQNDPAMAISMTIETATGTGPQKLTATGIDSVGPFTLEGWIQNSRQLLMVKKYTTATDTFEWKYFGTYDRNQGILSGQWGYTESERLGNFMLKRISNTISQTNPGLQGFQDVFLLPA